MYPLNPLVDGRWDYSVGLAALAGEFQSATMDQISQNASEAAHSTSQIAGSIASVCEAEEKASKAAAGTVEAAQQLAQLADLLNEILGHLRLGNEHELAEVTSYPKGSACIWHLVAQRRKRVTD